MRLTFMMRVKSVLLPLLFSIALIGCSKKSDAIQFFDKDGSMYFCGNNKWPWGMDKVPDWSLAFLSDGTVIHTYVMSDYTNGKHDVMQSKGTYRVSGDSVYFENWCNITPKARAEELSADRSTEYMERPTALTLELVEGKAVGLRPEFYSAESGSLYRDSYDLWTKETQDSRSAMIRGRYKELAADFMKNYQPPATMNCVQFTDLGEQRRREQEAARLLPDPLGTYASADGTISFLFLPNGRFALQYFEDVSAGKWIRNIGEVELVADDGTPLVVKLGDSFIVFQGQRFDKR